MKVKEMKERVYKLIEEASDNDTKLTDDPDYEKKMNTCLNVIQNELARIKKIPATITYDIAKGNEYRMSDDMYQINKITGSTYESIDNLIIFNTKSDGEIKIYYYKYPTQISEESDEMELELSQDILEIMPFGVAGDMLKADVSTNYGTYFSNRYTELKNGIDPRYNNGSIYIETGDIFE